MTDYNDLLVDPTTGRLRFDTQSREYRRIRRRQWLENKRCMGYKRLDVFLHPDAYERLLQMQEYGEGISDTIARALMEYE